MFTKEFEKTASLVGKALSGAGKMMGSGSAIGQRMVAGGEKMIQKSTAARAKSLAGIEATKIKNRASHLSEMRQQRGKAPLQMSEESVKNQAARRASKNLRAEGKPKPAANAGKDGGMFGFIRRNPVTSAVGAGAAGYMVGKPSNDGPQYQRPNIQ